MKLAVAVISFACLSLSVEGLVRFMVPSSTTTSTTSDSYDSCASSSSSCSSSSDVELLRDDSDADGRFGNLIKDDDLISLRKKKRKNKKRKSRRDARIIDETVRTGGKQPVGFIFNREWQMEMEKITGKRFNGYSEEFEKQTEGIVGESVNSGWWLFSFRAGQSVSKTVFKFKANLPVRASLVDLFCRGDSFAVLDGGKLIAQSSRVRADRECEETMMSPEEALADGRWSSVVFELDSGDHSIEIRTVDNAMGEEGGLAAIKFEYILPAGMKERRISREKVCRGYNGLFVVKTAVAADEAETVCLTMRSELAKVELSDPAVWKSVKTCLGRECRVWAFSKDKKDTVMIGLEGKNTKHLIDKQPSAVLCRVRS